LFELAYLPPPPISSLQALTGVLPGPARAGVAVRDTPPPLLICLAADQEETCVSN